MKCFHHTDRAAVATCEKCPKGLCHPCANHFESILCQQCLLKNNKSKAKEVYIGLAVTIAIFFSSSYFLGTFLKGGTHSFDFSKGWLISLLLAFTYWGWVFLTDYFPSLLEGTGDTWLMYFSVKFIASYFIGIIVGPYQILKMLKEIYIIQKTKKQVSNFT